jgi:hypothetical protein
MRCRSRVFQPAAALPSFGNRAQFTGPQLPSIVEIGPPIEMSSADLNSDY